MDDVYLKSTFRHFTNFEFWNFKFLIFFYFFCERENKLIQNQIIIFIQKTVQISQKKEDPKNNIDKKKFKIKEIRKHIFHYFKLSVRHILSKQDNLLFFFNIFKIQTLDFFFQNKKNSRVITIKSFKSTLSGTSISVLVLLKGQNTFFLILSFVNFVHSKHQHDFGAYPFPIENIFFHLNL